MKDTKKKRQHRKALSQKPKPIGIDELSQTVFDAHEYNILALRRELFLVGEVEADVSGEDDPLFEPGVEHLMATRFIRNLRLLAASGSGPIIVHMKTCGGYWEEGMAIYDAIRLCRQPVTILSYTHARSMSSIILQAATRRVLMPSSYVMVHRGYMELSGAEQAVFSMADFYKRHHAMMLDIYARRMTRIKGHLFYRKRKAAIAWLEEAMEKQLDVFLAADEAVRLGLADTIFDGDWEKLGE